jgi:hypothetical protein
MSTVSEAPRLELLAKTYDGDLPPKGSFCSPTVNAVHPHFSCSVLQQALGLIAATLLQEFLRQLFLIILIVKTKIVVIIIGINCIISTSIITKYTLITSSLIDPVIFVNPISQIKKMYHESLFVTNK